MLWKKGENLWDYLVTEYSETCDSFRRRCSLSILDIQMAILQSVISQGCCGTEEMLWSLGSLVNRVKDVPPEAEDSQNIFQVLEPASSYESSKTELKDLIFTDASVTSPTSTSLQTPPLPQNIKGKKRKGNSLNHYEKLLDVKQLKMNLLHEKSQSNNKWWWPYVPEVTSSLYQIPVERKMAFRNRVQLLADEFS